MRIVPVALASTALVATLLPAAEPEKKKWDVNANAGRGGDRCPRHAAWDMQTRFSPDGKRIAYVSDAGGGDNVWVMNADGTGARAVSSEDFRLLNNPVWHPSGEYVAARKHYSDTRSLGSGENWLFHASGGKGVALNDEMGAVPRQRKLHFFEKTPGGGYVPASAATIPELCRH